MPVQVQFWNSMVLFINGKVALDPSCCCIEDCIRCIAPTNVKVNGNAMDQYTAATVPDVCDLAWADAFPAGAVNDTIWFYDFGNGDTVYFWVEEGGECELSGDRTPYTWHAWGTRTTEGNCSEMYHTIGCCDLDGYPNVVINGAIDWEPDLTDIPGEFHITGDCL